MKPAECSSVFHPLCSWGTRLKVLLNWSRNYTWWVNGCGIIQVLWVFILLIRYRQSLGDQDYKILLLNKNPFPFAGGAFLST